MNPKTKVLLYDLTDSFKVHILLTPSSRKFYLSYRLYSLEKLVSFEESLFISPSISLNEYGNNSVSSLYRSIMGSTSTGYSVMDAFNDQSIYKKLPLDNNEETDYYYSFNSEQELHIDSSNYVFINKDLVKTKYPNGGVHPIRIHKMVNGVEHPVFKLNEFTSSVITRTITNNSDNLFVSFVSSEPNTTTVRLYKNNNIYETLDIIRDENDVITSIIRKRNNVIVESYSLSLSNNEYLVTDNILNNLIKITFDNVKDITSIKFGKNNTLLNHSTINFSKTSSNLIIEKATGQFTYLHIDGDHFDYSFDELGNFNKEEYELINSDRPDSWKLKEKISYTGNTTLCEEHSLVTNGYFSDSSLENYSISNLAAVSIQMLSNNYFKNIVGDHILRINPGTRETVVVSQEITSFPNGLPNILSFWSKVQLISASLKISYYLDNLLLTETSHSIPKTSNYSPNMFNLDAPSLTNKIIIAFEITSPLSRLSCELGAIRLGRENSRTTFGYNEDTGSLIKSSNVHDETKFNYQDKVLTSVSNSIGYASSFYYENKTLKETSNSYGGKVKLTYNNGYLVKKKTTSPIEGDESYMESSSTYIDGELINETNENGLFTSYEYSNNDDSLTKITDSILETSFNKNFVAKELVTSFKGINQTSLYSSNKEKYNNNYSLQTLTTNNFGYRYNYLTDNNLASVVCGSTPLPIFGIPVVSYSYQTNEYLSKDLISSKTINNTTYNFSYSDIGLLTSISNEDDTLFSFTYDSLGNITNINELESQTVHIFNYNINGNLIRESHSSMFVKEYVYDFENLMYTRVNDSIEDRMEFESNNENRTIDYVHEINSVLDLDNVYFGTFENDNETRDSFSLIDSNQYRLIPVQSSSYPIKGEKYFNISSFNFNEEHPCGLKYNIPTNNINVSLSFGVCFYRPLLDYDFRIAQEITQLRLLNNVSITAHLIQEDGRQKIEVVYGNPGTGSGQIIVIKELPINDETIHFVGFNVSISYLSTSIKVFIDDETIIPVLQDIYYPNFSDVNITFGKYSNQLTSDFFRGLMFAPFISLYGISEYVMSHIRSKLFPIYASRDLTTKNTSYSYKYSSFANYFPLKNSLSNKNQGPSYVKYSPYFAYDESRHHNVLRLETNRIEYDVNTNGSVYIFYECKLFDGVNNYRPLVTFVDKSTNNTIASVICNLSNHASIVFLEEEYQTNLSVPIDAWFSFGVAIKKQNNRLYVKIRINSSSEEVSFDYALPIDAVSIVLGSFDNQCELIYGKNTYLYGNIENLVYGTSYLSQVTYNQLRTAFTQRYKESAYDIFGRLTSNESFEFNHNIKTNYEYKSLNNKQTTLINKETHLFDDSEINEYDYQYVSNNKLSSFSTGETVLTYNYDSLGRISLFSTQDKTIQYQYDTYGNITSKTINNSGVVSTINYTYDSDNPTLLLGDGFKEYEYNGLFITKTYITLGARQYLQDEYSYVGSKLSSIVDRVGNSVSFKYGYNGLRNKKIVTKRQTISSPSIITEISYVYDGDKLILENHPDYQLRFQYDSLGKLLSIEKYNLNNEQLWKYYYIVNIFNDVLGLVNESGEQVVSYLYDPFGNDIVAQVLSSEDSLHHNNDLDVFALNPLKYKSYYFDTETGLYYLITRYYDPSIGRFISPDGVDYLEPNELSGLNLFIYCVNDPVNRCDPSGHMPEWAKWVLGGLAVSGLVVATVLTCGVAGAGAATVGAAMLAGGLVSAGINAIDQLHDGGKFDWAELAISTLSGTAYGAVVAATGGTGAWAIAGKFAVAGGTSLLNSWNTWDENSKAGDVLLNLGISLAVSGAAQGAGYLAGKYGLQIISRFFPRNPQYVMTMGDILSYVWSVPMVKVGTMRFIGGIVGSIVNDL